MRERGVMRRFVVLDSLLLRLLAEPPGALHLLGGCVLENSFAAWASARVEVSYSSGTFNASPESLARALSWLEEEGAELVGVYHAHPCGGARPSPLDVLSLRKTGLAWVIRSGSSLKAWVLEGSAVREVPLVAVSRFSLPCQRPPGCSR